MGLFKFLFNMFNKEGVREIMRMSYVQHKKLALRSGENSVTAHKNGLFGALGSRYILRGQQVNDGALWIELSPFLLMDEKIASELLAEYVVYQESPKDAKLPILTKAINGALRPPPRSDHSPRRIFAPLAVHGGMAWCNLLQPDIRETIEKEAQQIFSNFPEGMAEQLSRPSFLERGK